MDAKQTELLTKIANAPEGYAMVKSNSAALKALVAASLVETNDAMKKGLDIACRVTEAGKAALGNTAQAQPAKEEPTMTNTTAPAADKPRVFIVTGYVRPAKPARAKRPAKPKYDFGGLFDSAPVGGAFFVAAAAGVKHPNRATKLAARAHARAGVKRFAVDIVEAGKTYGSFVAPEDGALVERLPDADGPAEAKPRKKKAAPAA